VQIRLCHLIAVTALVAAAICVLVCEPLDGFNGYLYFRFHPDKTIWADGYSDGAFKQVRDGMTQTEVYALMGPPLKSVEQVFDKTYTIQRWTDREGLDARRRREIYFHGVLVIGKSSQFRMSVNPD
jgi:outer membrane protein assembly factor BamE (lipoprotein component of BamABCDE complex)